VGIGVLVGRGIGIQGPQLSPFKSKERGGNSLSTQNERISTVDDSLSYDFFISKPTNQIKAEETPSSTLS
jgi:hypothetical protein